MPRLLRTSLHTVFPAALAESPALDFVQRAAIAVAASLFVAVCAHIAVPLPFTPVPFTLQPFAVLLVGMLLGPSMGFAALALYLAEGAAGLPVFTPLGLPGVARLVGPTGGYLFAYPVASAIAGLLPCLLRTRRYLVFAASGLVAMLVVYVCGSLWFAHALHVSLPAALGSTVAPFALSDAVKVLAAAGMASAWAQRR